MKVTLINPNIVTQKGDFFGTGIPYMPIIPAYVAAFLRKNKQKIDVIDAFGEAVSKKRVEGEFIIQGLSIKEIVSKIKEDTLLICIYAGHIVEHNIIIQIIRKIKTTTNIPIAVIENSQAVTSYSLIKAKEAFFKEGVDFIIYGEPESTTLKLIQKMSKYPISLSEIGGIIYKEKGKIIVNPIKNEIEDLDTLPFPAWDLFPIKNYWKLGYAHAPFSGPYLPILSSRGCPYQCKFCIIPFTTKRRWYARTAKNVFDEMRYFADKYKVKEFHFEDLNATINKERIKEICRLIIKYKLKLKLKFASGIKIETIDKDTLLLLKKAGCEYISFSPESGSKKVLSLMNKSFDHAYGLKMLKKMHQLGITTQACFILGYPGEKKEDITETKKYLYKLFKEGLDETAILVMTPVPGSEPYETLQMNCEDLSKLTFSPKWRKNYKQLNRKRISMYITSYIIKLFFHPLKLGDALLRPFFGTFKTKVEMTLYRLIKVYF